jgi:nucleotide-binding universal stress UspA family protein
LAGGSYNNERNSHKGDDFRGNALLTHLRLHDLSAELEVRDDPDVPEAINHAAEVSRASLIIMGGYGHSRFREFIFGGATRHMLRRMQVPVLMALCVPKISSVLIDGRIT